MESKTTSQFIFSHFGNILHFANFFYERKIILNKQSAYTP